MSNTPTVTLEHSIKLGPTAESLVEQADGSLMFRLTRKRVNVTVPPTGANARQTARAGALSDEIEVELLTDMGATSYAGLLWDAMGTDGAVLHFVGKVHDGPRGPLNPEYTGHFVVTEGSVGTKPGDLQRQTHRYTVNALAVNRTAES